MAGWDRRGPSAADTLPLSEKNRNEARAPFDRSAMGDVAQGVVYVDQLAVKPRRGGLEGMLMMGEGPIFRDYPDFCGTGHTLRKLLDGP